MLRYKIILSVKGMIMVTNDEIVKNIKIFRQRSGKTQQDLANLLGKTAASISDLERGKVQISASELSQIADYLNIPISGFFGRSSEDTMAQEVIYSIQEQPEEARLNTIAMVKLYLEIQGISKKMLANPNKEYSPEELGEFVTKILNFQTQYKRLSSKLDTVISDLIGVLKEHGISLPQ